MEDLEVRVKAIARVLHSLVSTAASQRKRCCCCVCCGLVGSEIGDKNLMIGLCNKTSALYSRPVRLSILMVGMLTDLVICALFFSLDAAEEESFFFWDSLVQNLWVAFFSALFSIPPTLLVVLAFTVPASITRHLQKAESISQIKRVYRQHESRLVCGRVLGFLLFLLVSSFLCLYLIAFGYLAHLNLQKNWIQSSGGSLAIDLILFEVFPALFFGLVGILIVSCKCSWCLCLLTGLDFYRFFRNIAA